MAQSRFKFSIKNLAFLFFFANFALKVFLIDSIPPAPTYDELIYIAEAQAIVKYGTDLTGNWRPWHLEPSDSYYTELTSTVLTPGFILFPNNPILAAKFVPLLLGSFLPISLGLLAFRLRREKSVFILTALVATLNPWIFQFSRMGYDALFSISFYLMGILLLLYLSNWKKLWAVVPLFLGFYQYQGHKPLLVPFIFLCVLFLIIEKYEVRKIFANFKKIIIDKNIISAVVVFVFSVVLTGVYLVQLPNLSSGERISNFSIYDEVELSSQVNDARRLSLDSAFTPILINKFTILVSNLTDKFLTSFNLRILFIEGNRGVDTFAVLDYGYFHIIDLLAIALSLGFLFANKKDYRILFFLLSFIILATIPNVIRSGTPWIIFRPAFAFLGMIVLMGIGGSALLDTLKKKEKTIVTGLYVLLALPFFFVYFTRYPVSHTTNVGFYERIFASYVQRVDQNKEIYILPDRDDATFSYLIAYNLLLTKENQSQVNNSIQTRDFSINNIMIPGGCSQEIEALQDTTVFVYLPNQPCQPQHDSVKTTEIKSLVDTGTIFTIYNDELCSQYNLSSYPNIKKNVFAVEKLSDKEFCENFFSK